MRTLAVRELVESHTGEYLKSVIVEVLTSFQINVSQIYTVTTDNGANMVKCTNILQNELSLTNQHIEDVFGDVEEDASESVMQSLYEAFQDLERESLNDDNAMFRNGLLVGIRCGAHTLQLAVFDAIKKDPVVETLLSKARHVCKKLRTPTMSMLLKVRSSIKFLNLKF